MMTLLILLEVISLHTFLHLNITFDDVCNYTGTVFTLISYKIALFYLFYDAYYRGIELYYFLEVCELQQLLSSVVEEDFP